MLAAVDGAIVITRQFSFTKVAGASFWQVAKRSVIKQSRVESRTSILCM